MLILLFIFFVGQSLVDSTNQTMYKEYLAKMNLTDDYTTPITFPLPMLERVNSGGDMQIQPLGKEETLLPLIQLLQSVGICKEPPSGDADLKYTVYCSALLLLWLMVMLSLVIYQIRSALALRLLFGR